VNILAAYLVILTFIELLFIHALIHRIDELESKASLASKHQEKKS
jgi:hypothetical protein